MIEEMLEEAEQKDIALSEKDQQNLDLKEKINTLNRQVALEVRSRELTEEELTASRNRELTLVKVNKEPHASSHWKKTWIR